MCVCVSWRHLFIGINNFPFLAARKKKKESGISKNATRPRVCVQMESEIAQFVFFCFLREMPGRTILKLILLSLKRRGGEMNRE